MRLLIIPLALIVLAVSSAKARRVTADLEGMVRDEKELLRPGAIVAMRNEATGLERTIMTDESGRYLLRALPVEGEYEIRVELAGFATTIEQHLTLSPNQSRVVNFTLKVGNVIEPTDLVNQIYLRLAAAKNRDWQNRSHFFAFTSGAMRRHLIDCARARGNREFVSPDEVGADALCASANLDLLVNVSSVLYRLAQTNRDWSMIVELKYFLGMADGEVAKRMGIKLRTMERLWADARGWLYERVGANDIKGGEKQFAKVAAPVARTAVSKARPLRRVCCKKGRHPRTACDGRRELSRAKGGMNGEFERIAFVGAQGFGRSASEWKHRF